MVRRLLLCICTSVSLAGAAIAQPLPHARSASPFECQTRLPQLAAALHLYERVDAPADDEDDYDDDDQQAIAFAPEGVRVFGFEADELDVVFSATDIQVMAFVKASYDDVLQASTHAPACNGLECRMTMPHMSVDADDQGDTVISCTYTRAPPI